MGGQARVFYGGAEFSRDTDFAIHADKDNLERLLTALGELKAAAMAAGLRPLLNAALQGDRPGIEAGLAEEERRERAADRAYWDPLKKELERMRHTSTR